MDFTNDLKKNYSQAVLMAGSLIFGCMLILLVFLLINSSSRNTFTVSEIRIFQLMSYVFGFTALTSSVIVKNYILKNAKVNLKEALKRLNMSFLVSFALCEGAVLFGCLVYFLSKKGFDLFLPVLVGVIGFSFHFPRYDQWDNWIKNNCMNV